MNQEEDEGGFQSEPEIILLQNDRNSDDENEENKENEDESEANEANGCEQQDQEDETPGCPICLEPWANSGRHRLCSLRCGHLFGRQCIDRWLAGGKIKCPQCNAPAKRADIRVLYCKKLTALDTTEKERLEAQLETEKLERRRLEESLANSNLAAQVLKAELETLRSEISRLKKRKFSDLANSPEHSLQRSPLKFLRRAILGHGVSFQCRTVAFDARYGIFLVSRSDGDQMGGIVKVSLWDPSGSEFVALHDGAVRSIACSPCGDGLFLTCGSDDRLKLSTMSSNSVLQAWNLDSSPWSCTFHPQNINLVAVGLSSGKISLYDLSQPVTTPPRTFQSPQKSNYPVHSVHIVEIGKQFLLVGATMEGPFALKIEDEDEGDNGNINENNDKNITTWTSDFGYKNFACTSLSLDTLSSTLFLASYRSVPPREPSKHIVFELTINEDQQIQPKIPFSEFKSVSDGPNKIPYRSSLISSNNCVECLVPDETSFTGQCYQLSSSSFNSTTLSPIEVLSTNAGIPIIETCTGKIVQNNNNCDGDGDDNVNDLDSTLVIGMLTSKHLYIYTTST